jgi:hypothetical protein
MLILLIAATVASSMAAAGGDGSDKPRPAPKHVKFRNVIVGPDGTKVVAVVCRSPKWELEDAYLKMSSGDDDVDSRALERAKTTRFELLIENGKPVSTCIDVVVPVRQEVEAATSQPVG